MEKKGYLAQDERVVNGKERTYDSATDEGRAALVEIQEQIHEPVDEVLA